MTSLTPYRLFQLCKYALNRYTADSPLIQRTRRAITKAEGALESRRERRRSGGGSGVGYFVEERRGWDTRPVGAGGLVYSTETNLSGREERGRRGEEELPAYALRLPSEERSTSANHNSNREFDFPSNRPSPSSSPSPSPSTPPNPPTPQISQLMSSPLLFSPSFRPPREITVLCHGLYGFSTTTPISLFPALKIHYWHSVLEVLREELGCKIMVVGVKGTGSIEERARQMDGWLRERLPKGTGVNFVAHSMGGLDCRYLITHLKPQTYKPLSLTMIGTPNRGSPFMDWCAANIGVGVPSLTKSAIKAATSGKLPPYSLKSPILSRAQQLASESSSDGESSSQREARLRSQSQQQEYDRHNGPSGLGSLLSVPSMFGSSITNYLLGLLDSPAYGNLTTHYLNGHFNPNTPDDPSVKYLSTGGRTNKMSVLHPLWFPKLILDAAAERGYAEEEGQSGAGYEGNDGLVSVSSAKWGEWLGVVDKTHHWDLRGEGGLLPDGMTMDSKPEGRPDPSVEGGWDWEWASEGTKRAMKEEERRREEKRNASGGAGSELGRTDAILQAAREMGGKGGEVLEEVRRRMPDISIGGAGNLGASSKNGKPGQEGWDLAQVGQVIDWVADLMPTNKESTGDNSNSEDGTIGTKQLADAAREKAREDQRSGSGHSVSSSSSSSSSSGSRNGSLGDQVAAKADVRQTGQKGKRIEGRGEHLKGKFDLGRFYGGLMVKLEREGL